MQSYKAIKRSDFVLKQTNVRLEGDFLKEIKKICIDRGITFQDAVEEALTEWLKKNKGQ